MKRFVTREMARNAIAALMLAGGMLVTATAIGIMHDQVPAAPAPSARIAPVSLAESCGELLAGDGPMVAAVPLIVNVEGIDLSDGVATRGLVRELTDVRRGVTDRALGFALDEAIIIAQGRADWGKLPGTPWKFGPRFAELDAAMRTACGVL